MTDLPPTLTAWTGEFRPHPDGADLPPHHAQCLGCGPGNPHGHHLQVRRDGDGVLADHTFDERHVGAPGIVHGGAVATVIDDLYGFLCYLLETPAVTRHLTVDYRAPVMIGVRYRLAAHVRSSEGRKLFLAAGLTDSDGAELATSSAVFIKVGADHFIRGRQ
ncbi:PaaI family thioesterase [Actinomycetota bacterium]